MNAAAVRGEPQMTSGAGNMTRHTLTMREPMICSIPTIEKAQEIMDAALQNYCMYHPMVFDLNESLDPNDVPVCISRCLSCELTVHFKLGDDNDGECPRCRDSSLVELVQVLLVIQGSVVISTAWRTP